MACNNLLAIAVVVLCLSSAWGARESLHSTPGARRLQQTDPANTTVTAYTGVQTPITVRGAPYGCTSDNDCVTYLGWGKCDLITGSCYPGQFGQSCSSGANCQSNSCSTFYSLCAQFGCDFTCSATFKKFCWEGFCYPQRPNYSICKFDSHCLSNSCVNGICQTPAPPQQACGCPGCPACPFGTYCNNVPGFSGVCTTQLPNGFPCTSNGQCTSNNCINGFCSATLPPQAPCGCFGCAACPFGTYCNNFPGFAGVCVAQLPIGSPCSSDSMCSSNTCRNGLCSSPTPPAQVCGCPGCAACPFGTYCNNFPGFSGTCVPQLPNGFPCSSNNACTSNNCRNGICSAASPPSGVCGCPGCPSCPTGTYCNNISPGFGGTCVPKLPNGFPCSSDNACTSNNCRNGICSTPTPPAQVCGCAGCAACPFGTYCNNPYGQLGVCVSKLPNGSPCSSDNMCSSNNCLYGLCTRPTSPNVCNCPGCPSCPANQWCNANVNGQCVPLLSNGLPCSANNQCASSYCNPSTFKCAANSGVPCDGTGTNSCPYGQYCDNNPQGPGYRCRDQKPRGSSCQLNWECSSQACASRRCL